MHDCDKYLELISCLIDGEAITAEEERELNEHLEVCPYCRDFKEAMEAVENELSEEPEVPVELKEAVMANVNALSDRKKADEKRRGRKALTRMLTAAACVCLIIFVMPMMPDLGCGSATSDSAAPMEAFDAEAPAATEDVTADSSVEYAAQSDGTNGAPITMEPGDAAPEETEDEKISEDGGFGTYADRIEDCLTILRNKYDDKYAFVFIMGSLPDEFRNGEMSELTSGALEFSISAQMADELAADGFTTYYEGVRSDEAVAVYLE